MLSFSPAKHHYITHCVYTRLYLCEVVVYVERGQLCEVTVQSEGHEESSVFIGQFRILWFVVGDPGGIHLQTRLMVKDNV